MHGLVQRRYLDNPDNGLFIQDHSNQRPIHGNTRHKRLRTVDRIKHPAKSRSPLFFAELFADDPIVTERLFDSAT